MDFEIIDFHTHPFLENRSNLCMHKEVMNLSPDTVFTQLQNFGISRFCGSVIKMGEETTFQIIKDCNQDALKLQQLYKGAFLPGFQVHPAFLEESIAEIDFAHANGVSLIGELVPYLHHWEDYACREFSVLLDHIEKYHMAVSLHTGNKEQMAQMLQMAKAHPRVNFIFAHPGETATLLRHIEIMKSCPNVHLDISGTGVLRYGMLKRLVTECGAERILFGTDYPICNPALYIASVLSEEITDSQRQLIFSGNAKRLLHL